jgi:hypothetical protein
MTFISIGNIPENDFECGLALTYLISNVSQEVLKLNDRLINFINKIKVSP